MARYPSLSLSPQHIFVSLFSSGVNGIYDVQMPMRPRSYGVHVGRSYECDYLLAECIFRKLIQHWRSIHTKWNEARQRNFGRFPIYVQPFAHAGRRCLLLTAVWAHFISQIGMLGYIYNIYIDWKHTDCCVNSKQIPPITAATEKTHTQTICFYMVNLTLTKRKTILSLNQSTYNYHVYINIYIFYLLLLFTDDGSWIFAVRLKSGKQPRVTLIRGCDFNAIDDRV